VDLNRLRIDRETKARPAAGRRGRRRWAGWLVFLAVAAGVGWLLRAPILGFYDRLTLPAVEVVTATRASPVAAAAVSGTAANGYIVAARRAALSADTPGRVVEMSVEEGSVVRKGQVVARLYSKEYEAAVRRGEAELRSAHAAVAAAEAQVAAARKRLETQQENIAVAEARVTDAESSLELAQVEYDRELALLNKGAGTQDALDKARTALQSAKAKVTAERSLLTFAKARVTETEAEIAVAQANLRQSEAQIPIRQALFDEARATLEKTEVKAPFDGVVVLKDAEVGEVVSPNAQGAQSRGSVVTMVDFGSLEVQVDLPEKSLAQVAVDSPANIYLDAYPEIRYTGRVSRIWPTANRQKGTVELRIVFDRPDERLRPEMSVRVVFRDEAAKDPAPPQTGGESKVLALASCVVRIDGQTGVFVLERDVARFRRVELGEQRGGRVVVERGLDGGETLVNDPPPQLADGDRVRPNS